MLQTCRGEAGLQVTLKLTLIWTVVVYCSLFFFWEDFSAGKIAAA